MRRERRREKNNKIKFSSAESVKRKSPSGGIRT
jgi:hypothetical protein